MNKILPILAIIFLSYSCKTEDEQNENTQSDSDSIELISLTDHVLFACKYVDQYGLNKTTRNDIEINFNIVGSNEDSIVLNNCILKRSFYFNNDQLEAIKLSSYTDSLGMVNSKADLNGLKTSLSSMFPNSSIDSTLYSYEWINNGISYQLKIYPKEGVDLVISRSSNIETTNCVGDLYAAEEYLNSIIQKKITTNISLETLTEQIFQGISVSCTSDLISIVYLCSVSQKLKILDAKSIENKLSLLFSSKPERKDDMLFWTYSNGKIQLDEIVDGFSIKFIQ